MQAAEASHHLHAGPEVEVIGVGENNRRPQVFENVLGNGFDRAQGSDRHENRGFHLAVRGIETGEASSL